MGRNDHTGISCCNWHALQREASKCPTVVCAFHLGLTRRSEATVWPLQETHRTRVGARRMPLCQIVKYEAQANSDGRPATLPYRVLSLACLLTSPLGLYPGR